MKLIANFILLEKFGMIGAPIATVLCYLTASLMNIYFVIKNVGDIPDPMDVFVMPFVCAVIGIGTAVIAYSLISAYALQEAATLIAIFTAAAVYLFTVIKSRTVSEEEIRLAPKGELILNTLKRFKILK